VQHVLAHAEGLVERNRGFVAAIGPAVDDVGAARPRNRLSRSTISPVARPRRRWVCLTARFVDIEFLALLLELDQFIGHEPADKFIAIHRHHR